MRTPLAMTLAALMALPLATTASAGGFGGFSLPHLTWPQDTTTPERPTRQCAPLPF